ncbi:MAG: hypothetical protein WEB00_05030 [Dehalococcoidia bacterium]
MQHEPEGAPLSVGSPVARFVTRFVAVIPAGLALAIIAVHVWGYLAFPRTLAAFLLAFYVYWLWKCWTISSHAVRGLKRMKSAEATDWRQEYDAFVGPRLDWDRVGHVVLIPNYGEPEEILRSTLRFLAQQTEQGTASSLSWP